MQEIITPRLTLRLMTEDFLKAGLNAEQAKTESMIGLKISPDWFDEKDIMSIRLNDYRNDPEYLNWGLHAVGLRETNEMIGFIGFHSSPNPDYLQPVAARSIEFGYTIFFNFRRRGFAREACIGLMSWAAKKNMVEYFIASVSPLNIASMALMKNLEFKKIGEQMDEIDGLELIFALPVDKIPIL